MLKKIYSLIYITFLLFNTSYLYCDDDHSLSDQHYETAVNLTKQYDYHNAIKSLLDGIKVEESKENPRPLYLSLNYTLIGDQYYYLGKYSQAINYFTKAYNIDKSIKEFPKIIDDLNKIAKCYQALKDYKNAKKYLDQALNLSTNKQYVHRKIDTLNYLGYNYYQR